MKKAILSRGLIIPILFLQLIPLVLYPSDSFSLTTQEWWLPVLLAFLTILGSVELVFRHNPEPWPWYLISFAQGFNIISRLLMLMPQSTQNTGGGAVNVLYLTLSVIAMIWSTFMLWYIELPEVKQEITR
jgi:zinc transporter ZupT